LNLKASAGEIAVKLASLLRTIGKEPAPGTSEARRRLASAAAETARQASTTPSETKKTEAPHSIFVVHGHDEGMLDAVTTELERLGIVPVVLKRVRTSDDHLFAKFKAIAGDAKHAIVLISGDDVGASFRDFAHPAGGVARLEFRARQNVILELGYFYGKLGEECVFVFRKTP
jgi:predicted nucleotide-binding protein